MQDMAGKNMTSKQVEEALNNATGEASDIKIRHESHSTAQQLRPKTPCAKRPSNATGGRGF